MKPPLKTIDWLKTARFWSKVDVANKRSCWPFRGAYGEWGYAQIRVGGVIHPAHRVAYTLAFGQIPEGLVIRHRCDNPPCCNPHHLTVGTHADNAADMVSRGRSPVNRGERNPRKKLTEQDVKYIRENPDKLPLAELARRYDVCLSTIGMARSKFTWSHVG